MTETPGSSSTTTHVDRSDKPAAAGLLAKLWDSHHDTNLERVETIESAALALLDGDLRAELRNDASRAAHQLAGSLGTFGFDEGTKIARSAEALLEEPNPNPRVLSEWVVDLLEIVGTGVNTNRSHDDVDTRTDEPKRDVSQSEKDDRDLANRSTPDQQEEDDLLIVTDDHELLDRFNVAAAAGRRRLLSSTTPGEAKAMLSAHEINAMVVDLDLPNDRAIALVAKATEQHPDVHTYVLSTIDTFAERIRVAGAGAKGFLVKGTSTSSLIDLLDTRTWRRPANSATIAALDDDPAQLAKLSAMLDDRGFEVKAASTPEALWKILERDAPATVLLNLRMPDAEGVVLCRAIRAVPRWQQLPVLFVTSETDTEAIVEMFAVGADDYLTEPLREAELVARIGSHVERYLRTAALIGTDPLTGVANRRLSNERLGQLIGLAGRRAEPLSLAIIELDDHERMGSRNGQPTVERALRSIGEVLRENLRQDDVVGRWSDDRFVLGLYGAERPAATARLDEMLAELTRRNIVGIHGQPLTVTMSVGLVQFPTDGTDLPRLIAAADRELQLARQIPGTVHSTWSVDTEDQELARADVVVVDDDPVLADLLIHSLETAGHVVRHLSDGLAAAELLGAGLLKARLVLLDVGLPGMDGFSVLRALRDSRVLETTDVVMLTARSATQETLRALELGAVDFIGKPFSVPVLMERVEMILDRST